MSFISGHMVLLSASVCVYPLLVHCRDCFETRFILLSGCGLYSLRCSVLAYPTKPRQLASLYSLHFAFSAEKPADIDIPRGSKCYQDVYCDKCRALVWSITICIIVVRP